jgi:hypothetical protein
MSVYVDRARNRFGRMVMCHMLADTLDELHAMADRIGLRREWFQSKASTPHYDVSLEKRALAIRHGARDCSRAEIVEVIRRLRSRAVLGAMG